MRNILLPRVSLSPRRKDELWKETCFELFLALRDQPGYWEFNLSPSGDWNVYRMDGYRRIGFREEPSIQQLRLEFQEQVNSMHLKASIDLSSILQLDGLLDVGIAAVVQTKEGYMTFWALAHPTSQPDFHVRESFILGLAAQDHRSAQSAQDG